MTIVLPPQCLSCGHVTETGAYWKWRCNAFPEQIPHAILDNEVDHRNPVNGDGGLTFTHEPGMPWPLAYDIVFAED
jgi:hypothetical protein